MNISTTISNRTRMLAAAFAMMMIIMPTTSLGQQQTPPPPTAPRSVRFPQPVERTLKNGLRVIVIERSGVPLVSAQMTIKNGSEVDPPQLAGLANMTATLLTKGTASRGAPEIAEAIEKLGGSLESDARWDASTVTLSVMAAKIDPAMEILADVVRHPTFKKEEIERQRQQTLDSLSVALRQPGTLARFVASRVVFGDAPYGHSLGGTPETITGIKRDDIARLHTAYYRPNNAILVLGGQITPDAAFALAERLFNDWIKPSTELPAPSTEVVKSSGTEGKARVVVIDKTDAGQAAVVVARRGLRRTDEDYFRALVANSILGGGYSARLNQEIRIKRGLSYGAGSTLEVRRDVGSFIALTQTKNESGAEVAQLLIGEVGRLASASVPEAELVPRKAALIGTYARMLETSAGLVEQVASLALYGLQLDEINKYIEGVQAVAASDVQRLAGMRLAASGAHIIVVGNAKLFIDSLRKQFPNVEVIPENELNLNEAGLRRNVSGQAK
ncbi:MAG: insulinase family protein [Pyrinomonadaceae bacterium]|nr:insulinase family protein [Pyrinomonadaceae bacterium]